MNVPSLKITGKLILTRLATLNSRLAFYISRLATHDSRLPFHISRLFLILLLNITNLFSQPSIGGRNAFSFLNVPVSPRNTALGSHAIAWMATDAAVCLFNPALINEKLNYNLGFNHLNYFDGINFGNFNYTHKPILNGIQIQTGVQYFNTNTFDVTNEYGQVVGSTKASESNIYLGASKRLNERIQVGASFNFLFSRLGNLSSSGLGINAGVHYRIPSKNTEMSFVIRNAGFQFSPYQNTRERLPFTSELGIAKKLKHLPFVFHITAHHLESWNIRYDDPTINAEADLLGNIKEKSGFSKFTDNFFRHLAFGGEMLIGKSESFSLRLGYNHLRRMEVNINDYSLFGGLSFGFGFKVYMFRFDYSYANYHLAGGTNTIGLSTNLNSFKKQKS
ncbi:MAG: type IX secretion system protein PorQ [Saprospiraceae bacterium]|nr:type IX secretion system protein PorQ [Saprospiraceae bacterium]